MKCIESKKLLVQVVIINIIIIIVLGMSGFGFVGKNNMGKEKLKRITVNEAEKLIGVKPLKEVTSEDCWGLIKAQVFKYQENKDGIVNSYLVKNKRVMGLGYNSGKLDSKDICVSDLDRDGKPELLYYSCFGSGLNISTFKCYVNGRMIPVNFGSIEFCGFNFIKKDMHNVELGVWWPDIQNSDKNSIPIGKLYIKDNALCIKLYNNLAPKLKDYVSIIKDQKRNTKDIK